MNSKRLLSAFAALALLALPAVGLAQSDATLANLTFSGGTFDTPFNGTFSYTASVPYATASMTVTPTATDIVFLPTITVNGIIVASGNASGAISLSVGANVINTVVVSQDLSATNTYTLTVTRAAASSNANLASLVTTPVTTLTPTFGPSILEYTASVLYPIPSITVTPMAEDPLATIKVNGNTVASGSESGTITLIPGSNVINTVVTAEDASTKTYKITVTVTVADPVAIPGGPYAVSFGGGLALNGSASLPSDGNTITAYDWDLDNDGDYNDIPITGATPASISYPDLQSVHGMTVGPNPIKLRVTDSSLKTSTAEGTVTINPPVSIFTSGTVQPVFDGADQGYFNSPAPSAAGDKWFAEASGAGQTKGQTFTIPGDRLLKGITYRLTNSMAQPTKVYVVRIGAVDTATNAFYPLFSEEITQTVSWGATGVTDSYGTWVFATPFKLPGLPAGTVYGFDIAMKSSTSAWQTGIPYPTYKNTDVFAGGYKYTCVQIGGVLGSASNTVVPDSARDREFHLDMESTTIADTTAPTLVSIGDNVSGGPIYEDQVQVMYTLTFDEAIDQTKIDLADFENLGSGVSIDSVVSVHNTTPYPVASVVKVVLVISGTGTLKLGVKSGSDIADIAGNLVTSPVADDTTITRSIGTNPGTGNRWWDGTATTGITDGASQGGSATWDTTTTSWDRGFGFAAPVAWNNADGNTAIFGGTAGTVTLDNDITLEGLTVNLPSSTGSGYSIGNVGEDNTLTFGGAKTVTTTATGTGINQDVTIRAGIAGSPTMNIAGRLANSVNSFSLLPGAAVTQTVGTLNMLNTFASNKRLILGGDSTGNVVDTVTWSVTANQLMLTKAGTGSWTINNDLAFNTGGSRASRLYVEQGTLTLGGTQNFLTHKIGVSTVRETTFTASLTASKLIAKGTITIGDNREFFYVQNLGTLSPGPGVATLQVKWNGNNNTGSANGAFNMQTGSTYEWDIASSTSTDVVDVQRGISSVGNLILGNMTIKIMDAGVSTPIAASDQLTVFTYQTGVTRTIGTVTLDTTSLGAGWSGTPSLVDNGTGTIYLTGLSKSSLPPLTPPVLDPGTGFTMVDGNPTFTFSTIAGYKYRVVYSEDVSAPLASWLSLPDTPTTDANGWVVATSGSMTLRDPEGTIYAQRFYVIQGTAP